MLTSEGCAARRKRLWDLLPAPCDLILITEPHQLIYFANFVQSPFVFRSCEATAVLAMLPDRAILFADNVQKAFSAKAHVDEVSTVEWYTSKTSAPHRRANLNRHVIERLSSLGASRVGVEGSGVPAELIDGALRNSARSADSVVDLDPIIRKMRRCKDSDEMVLMRRSIKAGEAGLAAALEHARPGMTELDVYLLVQNAAMRDLGDQAIVYGDFASGPRCETERGGPPTDRVIEPGDLLIIDYSVIVDGYRGDFTNTFAVGGEPTSGQIELYNACMGAMEAGEKLLRPDVACKEIDSAVRGHLAKLNLVQYFPSHSGHGLGLGHPDPPYIVPESTDTLQAGDVVTLEPGLYIQGVGGMRFERNYLITDKGYETLSRHQLTLRQ
jgi:Xaa-Pro aminopeptidase